MSFFTAILPSKGLYCLAYMKASEKMPPKHLIFTTKDELDKKALELSAQGFDVYFAVGSLKNQYVEVNGRKHVRVKENILALRSIFLDLDVDPDDPKKFQSPNEAISETRKFADLLNWPVPIVVRSGNGYHLYWPLTEDITPEQHGELMQLLKRAAQHADYKMDRAATDCTRILRVPGTKNYKDVDNPKDVELLRRDAKYSEFDTLLNRVRTYLESVGDATVANQNLQIPSYLTDIDTNLYREFADIPLSFDRVISKCGALKRFVDMKAHTSYQFWLHSLQTLRFCEDGRTLCHSLSSQSSKYDAALTNRLLDDFEAKNIPPTLCERFAQIDECYDVCVICPQRNKIRTPASLGRDLASVHRQMEDEIVISSGTLPSPPAPYTLTETSVVQEVTLKDGSTDVITICPYPLKPIKRVFSERTNDEWIVWHTKLQSDGEVEIRLPASTLYDKRDFALEIAKHGIYIDLRMLDNVRNYMITYSREVQRLYPREMMYSRIGWRDGFEFFVYKDVVYYVNGATRPCATDLADRLQDALVMSGSLEQWKKIVSFFEDPRFAAHQFAIGTAFGSVLMPFTGLSGGIVSLVGKSGEGKSTIQKIVNSVWGHPLKLMLPAESKSSTYNAKISFINQMNNLPICAEEITNAPTDEVGALAYAITQGTEKWRADQRGQVQKSHGGWCTTMLSSSNSSLHEKLFNSVGAVAKALRIFEYHVPHVRIHDRAEFRAGVDIALMSHYGLAGDVYLSYLTRNLDAIKRRLSQLMIELDDRHKFVAEERVWAAVIATNIVGIECAMKCGLVKFNLDAIHDFVNQTVTALRNSIADLDARANDVLSQFINENISGIIVINKENGREYVEHKPHGSELVARYDVHTKQLHIAVTALKAWCNQRGYSYNMIRSELASIAPVSVVKCRLGAGTGYPSPQCRALAIDMSGWADDTVYQSLRNLE